MKRWTRKRVVTVKFSSTTQRHAVHGSKTCCSIDMEAMERLTKKDSWSLEERPIADIGCVLCLKRGGFLPRRKGKCLVALNYETLY